jgi:PAS domain S-box-containing protein
MDKETAWEAGQQSAVLVPLFGRKRIIGGLSALGKNGGGSFSSHDLDILTMFANQISIAIENAMLFRQVNNQIDEGRRKELIIREREEWFRAIFNATNEAIFIHDMMTGDILDVNQRMCEMYGYARDEALSVDVAALSSGVPPYTQEGAMERIQLAAENSPQVFEWQAKDKDGRLFWVEVNSRKADIGTEKRLIVTVRDITERKGVEKEIAQYRERLEILVRERTAELEEKNLELQRMNKLFVGRELRMVELKERIRALEKK